MNKSIIHQGTKVLFGNNLTNEINRFLKSNYKHAKKIIITDENVFDLWIENLVANVEELQSAEIIQLPAGETNKSIDICYQVWQSLSDYEINRNDIVINFGGGVITDMGGFIASTYKRGLDFINIPTTLLSQVDASIGGKTGINLENLKNQIGTFTLPKATFIDYNYLSTLATVDLKSGYAEMLKHGLIYDKLHWNVLIELKELTSKSIQTLIYDSVLIKHKIVTKDPNEKNIRKVLNFGHTIGHAIESLLLEQNKSVPHGYAVAWGMLIESKLSTISHDSYKKIETLITASFGTCPLYKCDIPTITKLVLNDKKNDGTSINLTLLDSLGHGVINQSLDTHKLSAFLNQYFLA